VDRYNKSSRGSFVTPNTASAIDAPSTRQQKKRKEKDRLTAIFFGSICSGIGADCRARRRQSKAMRWRQAAP
jgi:hypothetical protein